MRKKTVTALLLAMVMVLGPVPGQAALAANVSDSGVTAGEMTIGKEEETQESGKIDDADSEAGAEASGASVNAAAKDGKEGAEGEVSAQSGNGAVNGGTGVDSGEEPTGETAKDGTGSAESQTDAGDGSGTVKEGVEGSTGSAESGTDESADSENGTVKEGVEGSAGSAESKLDESADSENGTVKEGVEGSAGSAESKTDESADSENGSAESKTEEGAESGSGTEESNAPGNGETEAGAGTAENSGVTDSPKAEGETAAAGSQETSAAEAATAEEEDWRPTDLIWEKGVPGWKAPSNYATSLELYRDDTMIYSSTSYSGTNEFLRKEARYRINESGTYRFRVKFLKTGTSYTQDSEWAESPEWVYERPEQSVSAPKGYWSDSQPGVLCYQGVEGVKDYLLYRYVLDGEEELSRGKIIMLCDGTAAMHETNFLTEMSNYGGGKWRVQIIAISPDPEQMADGIGEFSDYCELTFGSQAPYEGASYELKYTVDADGLTIIGYTGTPEGQLVIPDEMDGKPVLRIGNSVFSGCKGFQGDLVLPDSVTEIGSQAFYGCNGLTGDLTLPDSVTEIGSQAFYGCSGFNGKLTLSSGLKKISGSVFQNCSGLSGDLVVPDNVTEIDSFAFNGCSGFNGKLVLPENLTTLGNAVFQYCSGLTGTLELPVGLTELLWGIFDGCSGFTGSLVIPEHVTFIDQNVFSGCTGLTGELRIPASVEHIDQTSFEGCEGLRDIYLTGNLKEVTNGSEDYSAFARESCTNAEVTIHAPEGSFAEEYALKYGHSFVAEAEPSVTPDPTPTPGSSDTPDPTPTPGPSDAPNPTPTPGPGESPAPSPSGEVKGEISNVVPESVMTDAVKTATGCNSVSELVNYLKKLITTEKAAKDILSGVTEGNSQVVDVSVMINRGGQWVEATADTFPAEGVDIVIPYPTGVDRNSYDFVIGHLIVMGCNGRIPGTMEYLKPEKTEGGLKIHVYSASPFVVAWKETEKKPEEKPEESKPAETESTAPSGDGKSPKTYDSGIGHEAQEKIPVSLWVILAVVLAVGGGFAAVEIRKFRRKNEEM